MFPKLILITLLSLHACNSARVASNSPKADTSGERAAHTSAATDEAVWKPATFKGLRIGGDHREDVLKLLGQPSSSREPEAAKGEEPEVWDDYLNVSGYDGHVIVISTKENHLLLKVAWYPEALSLEESKRIFGDQYKITRYDFVVGCSEDNDSAPIYENPKGNLSYIEYRAQGIAISTDSSGQKVDEVLFVSKPIGLASPRCQ